MLPFTFDSSELFTSFTLSFPADVFLLPAGGSSSLNLLANVVSDLWLSQLLWRSSGFQIQCWPHFLTFTIAGFFNALWESARRCMGEILSSIKAPVWGFYGSVFLQRSRQFFRLAVSSSCTILLLRVPLSLVLFIWLLVPFYTGWWP